MHRHLDFRVLKTGCQRTVSVELAECSVECWQLLMSLTFCDIRGCFTHAQVVWNSRALADCLVLEAVVEDALNGPFMVRFPWIHRSRKRKTWTLKQRSHVCPEKRAAFGLPARMTHRPAAASASMLEEKKKVRRCTTFVLVSPHWLSMRMSSSRFYCTWSVCPGSTITRPQWDPQRSSMVGSWVTGSPYRKRKQFVPLSEEVKHNTLARI